MKKTVCFFLTVLLLIGIFSGCGSEEKQESSKQQISKAESSKSTENSKSTESSVPETDEEVTLSIMFGEHSTMLYHPDTWIIFDWAKENYNINLELTAIPAADWGTKQSTVLASQELPDMLMSTGRDMANQYGSQGMFLNLYDYKESLPCLMAAAEEIPAIKAFMHYSPTEIYAQPTHIFTNGGVSGCAYYIMFIRRDIMNELGIKDMPTTFEGLEEVFRKMKEAYPDSYPWINRSSFDMILNVFAPGLGFTCSPMSCSNTGYGVWKEDTKTFTSVMEEENFRWFLGWMNGLYNEGLIDPNYAADDTATWQDKLDNSQGFFSVDFFSRPDTMTLSGKKITESFELEALQCPALPGGQNKVYTNSGVRNCNSVSADCKYPERLLEFIDGWFYSEEGSLVSNYGIEGKTYTKNEDGTLNRILTDAAPTSLDFDAFYGVSYTNFYALGPDFYGYDLFDSAQSEIYNKTWNYYKDDMIEKCPTIFLDPETQAKYNEFGADLISTLRNVFTEFVIGRRDVHDDAVWNSAKEELQSAGYEEYLKMLTAAV